jgi:glycosyltransferase involved in cell wall biosynthesis
MPASSASEFDASIVIPARNEAGYIRGALASVAAQSWPLQQLECIVVDNGSIDSTADVVRSWTAAHRLPVVQLLREEVAGTARAKNRGARAARGSVLIFLDADSRMAPDLVERILARVRLGYPAGSIMVIADSDDWIDQAFFGLIEFGKRLFHIHAQMLYCARDLFLEVGGFQEDLRLAEDRDLLVRLERRKVPVCHVTDSWIATSPRRLHALPLRLGVLTTFVRWALAHGGIGRRWRY